MVIPAAPLAHHRPRGESPVGVERFNPVVIFNAQLFRVGFAKPDVGPPRDGVSISRFRYRWSGSPTSGAASGNSALSGKPFGGTAFIWLTLRVSMGGR